MKHCTAPLEKPRDDLFWFRIYLTDMEQADNYDRGTRDSEASPWTFRQLDLTVAFPYITLLQNEIEFLLKTFHNLTVKQNETVFDFSEYIYIK